MADDGRHYIGQSVRRVEDGRLVRGRGRYVDDFQPAGCLFVAFVRCPHAHARIAGVDVSDALQAPGVIRVVTAKDVAHLGSLPVNRSFFPAMHVPPHLALGGDVVQAAGVPVAAVVADDAYRAWDAAELVRVDYEPLAPLAAPAAALAPNAPNLFPDLAGNRSFSRRWAAGDIDEAFRAAARVVRVNAAQPRVAAVALETLGILASCDPLTDELTVWIPTQAPARMRSELARILGIAETRLRVISPEVGGAFGTKTGPYREHVLVAFLAEKLRRPVKWMSTRAEDLRTTQHGRGSVAEGELALDSGGRITALRARIVYPLGTSLSNSASNSAWNHARALPGAYVVPACDIEVSGVYTTTAATGAYRGAGRPEAAFLIERLIDDGARSLGIDPVEIRRRNFVPPDRFPYKTVTGQLYDSGNYAAALDEVVRLCHYDEIRSRQRERQAAGEIVGIGFVSYVEPCAAGWESGTVRVERDGAVTVLTGAGASGQGHETTLGQIAADVLGVDVGTVGVRRGDTAITPPGFGSVGSRTTAVAGGAVATAAAAVRDKGRRIAAKILEAAPEDVRSIGGGFEVTGSPGKRLTWRHIADAAYAGRALAAGDSPGLETTSFFTGEGELWSFGAAMALVSIDPETGVVSLERFVWVDDAGTIVNPLLAEGQMHGGLAQGLGQAFFEEIIYDTQGQLVTGTLMDYAVPRAADFREPTLSKTVTPSPWNPLGAKGLGEGGCIAAPPAIVNAVVDALAGAGISANVHMPLTPERVWTLVRERRSSAKS